MGAHRLFYRTEFFRCGACKGLISDGDELFFHFAVGQHFSHGTVPILDFAGSCACWRVQAVGGTKGQGGQVSPYSYSVKAFRPSYTITRILGMAPPLAMLVSSVRNSFIVQSRPRVSCMSGKANRSAPRTRSRRQFVRSNAYMQSH